MPFIDNVNIVYKRPQALQKIIIIELFDLSN